MLIDNELKEIFESLFKIDKSKLTEKTSIDDIEEWDSLEHIKLILEIEEKYNIKFDLDVIPHLTIISKIQDEIDKVKKR